MRAPWLRIVLWLMAAHSLGVGIGLMFHPPSLLSLLGFRAIAEPFFVVQGGVFHVVMAIAYALGALDPERRRALIGFAIVVKTIAAVFLLTWWALAPGPWSVAVSGLVDGGMAVALATASRRLPQHRSRRA